MTLSRAAYPKKNYGSRAFLWGLLIAACIVIPVMIRDGGCFLYYGDFNVQEIPFYRLAHDAVLSGETGWSHLTDLGANFIGSYSFYLLGSPFFYLTLPLPTAWVAYAIGPLLILKLGCCSWAGYLFLRRYVRDKRYAVIGGLLYAFSGFSFYNIFFFHFHEAMIVFPLLLAAMDEFRATGRKGVVAVSVCAAAVVNYYFFFGQAVFLLIYYVLRLVTSSRRFSLREFLLLAAEVVIGVMCAMFLLLPSIAAITGNYRTSQFINGWNALIYQNPQRYVQILVSLFFPGDLPARANFTANAGARWASVAAYLPMFSTVFVIAFFRRHRKSFFSILLKILLIMAFVPVLNSAFQAFNQVYYARWFYMLTLSLFIVGYGSLYLWIGKLSANQEESFLAKYALNGGEDITLEDLREVRSDFYRTYDNIGIYWQTPNIQAFHSIVPGALMEFYNRSGVKRDVGSRPEPEQYGFRGLLSVKYLFAEAGLTEKDKPDMPYFSYIRTENGYDIYENQLYVPMGFTFDSFITREEYLDLCDDVKHLALMKALVLTQEQMKKYKQITGYSPEKYRGLTAQFDETHPQNKEHPVYPGFDSLTAAFDYSKEAYREDAERLMQHACSGFRYTKEGFEAEFDNKGGDNLLFFSIPYDEGWTATVNGEDAEIEVVDIGLMAVEVKGHEKSRIEFRYTTPLLKEGVTLSLIGAGLLAVYLIISKGFRADKKYRKHYRIKNRNNTVKEGSV